jgi:hypothetical protein
MVRRGILVASLSLGLHAAAASAQSGADQPPPRGEGATAAAQTLYKGVVGTLLEAAPLESEDRRRLQQLSSVLSSPFSARSLALALGIASPPLMVLGLIWGLWSANQIAATQDVARRPAPPQSNGNPGELTAAPGDSAMRSTPAGAGSNQQLATASPDGTDPFASLSRRVDAGALSQVVGGAANSDPVVPCEYCIMPLLYPRATPDVR